MSSLYHKWIHLLSTKRVSASSNTQGADDSAVELTGFARPAAKELHDLSVCRSLGVVNPKLCNSDHDVDAELQPHQHRGINPRLSRPDSHARPQTKYAGVQLAVEEVTAIEEPDDALGASCRQQQALQQETTQSLQQHWQGAEPHVRLVLSILFENLTDSQHACKVDDAMYSRSWQVVFQQMVDAVSLCTILEHYFPDSIDSTAVAEQLPMAKVGSDSPSGLNSKLCHSSGDNVQSGLSGSTDQQKAFCVPVQVLSHPLADSVAVAVQVSKQQIKQQQQQQFQQQQQLHCELAAKFLTGATAAGIQLPASCSVNSIVSSNAHETLQLLLAVVIAGEVQQHLSDDLLQCLTVLRQQQHSQQLPGQQNVSVRANSLQSAGGSIMQKNTTHSVCADTVPSSQQTSALPESTWALLQSWLKFIAQHSCGSGSLALPEITISSEAAAAAGQQDGISSQQVAGTVQQQAAESCSGVGTCSSTGVTWQHLVTALQQLRDTHGSCCQQQQPQQMRSEQQTHTTVPMLSASSCKLHCHPSGDTDQYVSRCKSGSTNANIRSVSGVLLQQQLQQLGCALPLLLQQDDLVDAALQGTQCPNALLLVLLLRLVGCTSSLWLPAVQAAVSTPQEPEAIQQPLPNSLKLPQHDQQCTGQQSSSVSLDSESPRTIDEEQSMFDDGSTGGVTSPRDCWPPELLTQTHLWPGDEEDTDAAAMTREERTLRRWINSILHRHSSAAGSAGDGRLSFMSRLSRASSDAPVQYAGVSKQGSYNMATELAVAEGGDACCGNQRVARHSSSSTAGIYETDSTDINNMDMLDLATACTEQGAAFEAELGSDSGAALSEPQFDMPSAAVAVGSGSPSLPLAITASALTHAHSTGASKILAGSQGSSALSAMAQGTADVRPSHFSFSSISSLFGAEIRSGVLLLELLDHLQPGCVDWKLANKLPFRGVGIAPQLQALENCQLALKVAQEDLGLPLVSISARDVVLGRRKLILSLVYQLMSYHTMQMLESIAAVQQQQRRMQQVSCQQHLNRVPSAPLSPAVVDHADGIAVKASEELPSVVPRAVSRVRIGSSSKKQRKGRQIEITEDDILAWANAKLESVQPLPIQCGDIDGRGLIMSNTSEEGWLERTPIITSFKDPIMSSGVVLLQLLHVMRPDAVDLSYVTPGITLEQRQSNAKYALSVAKKIGCSLFLVWEDLIDLQPKLLLILLASLMFLDLTTGS